MTQYDRVRRAITTDPANRALRVAGLRGSVSLRPKIAIDVFHIFVHDDDDDVDEDERPISRGVIYERLSAKIVFSRARRSRTAQEAFIACQGEIRAG